MRLLAYAKASSKKASGTKASQWGAFLFWLFALSASATGAERALDGDTMMLDDRRVVRLIGINSPEFGKDGRADEPLAREAKAHLQQLIDGRRLTLTYEAERYDHYGRTLAHVLADNEDVQLAQIRAGFAFAVAIPPNTREATRYFAAETAARQQRRGVWAHPYFQSRAANALTADAAGFRLIHGQVQSMERQRYGTVLTLAPTVTIFVPHAASADFSPPLSEFVGKMVHARGWLSAREQRLRLRIGHPAMLSVD